MLNRLLPFRLDPQTSILGVLVLTLGLSGVMAYHAHQAAGSHRQAADVALRDYATFASWELERRLADALPGSLQHGITRARLPLDFRFVTRGRSIPGSSAPASAAAGGIDFEPLMARAADVDRLVRFEAELRRELSHLGSDEAVRDFFLLDLTGEEPSPEPLSLPPPFRTWLEEVLVPEALASGYPGRPRAEIHVQAGPEGQRVVQRMIGPTAVSLNLRPLDESSARLVYMFTPDLEGEPVAVYGFVLDVPALARPIIRSVVETAAFLPPSLTGGAANEELLAIHVKLADGETLYRSGDTFPASAPVVDTLHSELATLVTEVAVRPEVAAKLIIGGLPRTRLPLLLALLGLTLGLVAIAAVQLHRQRVLTRLRSDFVSGVSHELRTPLAQIQLFAELLGTDRLRRDQRERSVRVINEESRRLIYLVENILRFSSTERRTARIAPEPTVVAPFIRDIVESFAPLARSREATLVTDLDEDVCAPLDRSALRQVLLNLLDNAVKYGPRGQRVAVAAHAVDSWLRITVTDQGPGVPPAERQGIWRPYQRLRRDAESATGGSGIGLAVVRELVELHGGRVAVADAPAGGARFEVWIPAVEPATSGTLSGEPDRALAEASE